MPSFSTVVVSHEVDVQRRLGDFDLVVDQFTSIARVARNWADDASPLMPQNAPGTLAYIFGVQELRQQIVSNDWEVDRTCGIEAVVNRSHNIRIAFQNVDRACDHDFPPSPRSAKGNAAEHMCGPNLFEFAGIEPGPLMGIVHDRIPTYYAMVGEDGSVELSHPVVKDGHYAHFVERIFIFTPVAEWDAEIDTETGPINDFDVSVYFKDES